MVMGDGGKQFLAYATERFPDIDLPTFGALLAERLGVFKDFQTFFGDHDVILSPTWANPPFQHSADIASYEGAIATLETLRPVTPANLLGLPAAVVPVGFADDLPVGAQLTAWSFGDLVALDVAQQLEDALGRITPIDPR